MITIAEKIQEPQFRVDGVWLPEWQIAAALNEADIPAAVDVPVATLEAHLRLHGLMARLSRFAAEALTGVQPHDAAVLAASELVGLIASPRLTVIEMSDPEKHAAVKAMLDAILTAEQLSQQEHAEILALSDGTVSWAQQNLGRPVTADEISQARPDTVK